MDLTLFELGTRIKPASHKPTPRRRDKWKVADKVVFGKLANKLTTKVAFIAPRSSRYSRLMTACIAIRTELTPDEVRQGMRLNRTRMYWPRLFLANWYSTLLLVVIVWANIARLVDGKPLQPASLGFTLIPLFFLWFSWNRTSTAVREAATQLSDSQGSATVDANGISAKTSTGATSFVPWRDYIAWKEGVDVFTLATGKSYRILSKRGLSEADLEQLRSLFRTQIS
jgi:hypothetical protein